MIELLAIPGWKTQETELSRWTEEFASRSLEAVVDRESTGVAWITIAAPRLRGYAVLNGKAVEAINFELDESDVSPARAILEEVANAIGWELHEDDPGEADDDDDDDD